MLLFKLAELCGIVLDLSWNGQTCFPTRKNQRVLYNGHKKVHAIKFQSAAVPNSLVANFYGPVEGKRHDRTMLAESSLYNQLVLYSRATNGDALCLYGDPAYPHRPQLQIPFKGARLTQNEMDWNSVMSSVRVSVEWIFKDIILGFHMTSPKFKLRNYRFF